MGAGLFPLWCRSGLGEEWPNTNRSLGSRRSTEADGQEVPQPDYDFSRTDGLPLEGNLTFRPIAGRGLLLYPPNDREW
jgi:hypothetical protein